MSCAQPIICGNSGINSPPELVANPDIAGVGVRTKLVDEEVKANLIPILLGTRGLRSFSLYYVPLMYHLLPG